MPIYSIREILDIIKDLPAEQRLELQRSLPSVLEMVVNQGMVTPAQHQNMTGITVSHSNAVRFSQNQADRGSQVTQNELQATIQTTELQAALDSLKQLKRDLDTLHAIPPSTIDQPIATIETELKKPQPSKNLIDQAIEALKKGLAGVEVLAEPVKHVAELIARAWVGL